MYFATKSIHYNNSSLSKLIFVIINIGIVYCDDFIKTFFDSNDFFFFTLNCIK